MSEKSALWQTPIVRKGVLRLPAVLCPEADPPWVPLARCQECPHYELHDRYVVWCRAVPPPEEVNE